MDENLDRTLDAVGPRLKQLRQRRNITLTDLAEETGISTSTLSRLEAGLRRPTLEQMLPLARAHSARGAAEKAKANLEALAASQQQQAADYEDQLVADKKQLAAMQAEQSRLAKIGSLRAANVSTSRLMGGTTWAASGTASEPDTKSFCRSTTSRPSCGPGLREAEATSPEYGRPRLSASSLRRVWQWYTAARRFAGASRP